MPSFRPHAPHARSAQHLEMVLQASCSSHAPAVKTCHLSLCICFSGPFWPTDQRGGTHFAATSMSCNHWTCVCNSLGLGVWAPPTESLTHLKLGPTLHAVIINDPNVSLANVDDVLCLLPVVPDAVVFSIGFDSNFFTDATVLLAPESVFGVGLVKQPDIPLQWALAQGFCLLPPNEVGVAEVLDTQHVGEDKTGGKWTNGTFNNDMANEMEMSTEKCATEIPFTLSQYRVPTTEKCGAVWIVHCQVRTRKCASARARVGVVFTPPVALTAVASGWVRNSDSATTKK